MIIDIHTHSFPPKIAQRAVAKLSASSDTPAYTDGTLPGLTAGMKAAGIDLSVLMPVITAPGQEPTVNRTAMETNARWRENGVMSFGGIHPDNTDYKTILRTLAANGIKGIKLHPVFYDTYLDDLRLLRIIEAACAEGLWVLTHAGYDISYPGVHYSSPAVIRRMIDQVQPDKLILAHMGGWGQWDETEELLLDYPLWLDTSTCLTKIEHLSEMNNYDGTSLFPGTGTGTGVTVHDSLRPTGRKFPPEMEHLPQEQFIRMVRRLGADRVLMGSDSPWTPQNESIRVIAESALTEAEKAMILGENARRILEI